ncbi:hypothetical protein [Taibaiella chishuiensis]|uniref:Uncharacterized protein n=1 Tax=Taibaiella chishuiensis TaxID=1434707 RepID=A0A2P8CV59_9BACT|nr:hypothetical protein [Taibaiella chishuiensis]PSK88864.1 hypothetical protein B0I18_11476 [Taibaiella chishuiensis]
MRYLTYFTTDNQRIDIKSNWLGEEKIYHNGKLVSSQQSILGSYHSFSVIEHDEPADYQVRIGIRWPARMGFDIYRNGRALLLS